MMKLIVNYFYCNYSIWKNKGNDIFLLLRSLSYFLLSLFRISDISRYMYKRDASWVLSRI